MGGVFSYESDVENSIASGFVVVSNAIEKELHFDPTQSHVVAFGIDKQIHPNYKHKSLGLTVKLDALETSLAFVKRFNIQSFNVYCSSDQPDTCTHSGIVTALKDNARLVGKDGLLVLFFGGHGINDSSNFEWAFAPSDFDMTQDTYLTMSTLTTCLTEVQCLAKHILLILDCCYAGKMATNMTNGSYIDNYLLPHFYVLAAGTDYQSSLGVGALHHSIFSYFLKYSIYKSTVDTNGVLPLVDIFEESQLCCRALSSLILCKDDEEELLKINQTVPVLAHFSPILTEEVDAPAAAVAPAGRLDFVIKLFDSSSCAPTPRLHEITHGWLRTLIQLSNSPLLLLAGKGLLSDSSEGCVLSAVIALLMHSIALIELTYNRPTVGNPNTFLVAFINAIATIDIVQPDLPIDAKHLLQGWALYHNILVKNGIDNNPMKFLYQNIHLLVHNEALGKEDSIPVPRQWEPL